LIRRIAMPASVATILVLNLVLCLGLLGWGETTLFGVMLGALHVVLPISSVLMLVILARERSWIEVGLFATVVIGMLAVFVLRLTGVHLSGGLHLATDLAALNIYGFVVTRRDAHGRRHARRA